MTKFKKTILFLHRWLGFISGIVVFIVSITGCIFCFQDEIQDAFYSHRHVQVQQKPYLEPSVLKGIAAKHKPTFKPGYLAYAGVDRPALLYMNSKTGTNVLYINPYDGKILHDQDMFKDFFIIVEYIHLYLLLPANIGQLVVGISVIIFVVIMITGVVLWWPKRKSDRKRSFTIKWGGRWRRVNYDLHNVLGFYSLSIAIILAITGLAIAFEWMSDGIYLAGNMGKTYAIEKDEPKSDSLKKDLPIAGKPVIDRAYHQLRALSPNAEMYTFYEDEAASGHISTGAYAKSLHFANSDSYDFDKYTGKILKGLPQTKKSLGLKLNEMNYDIHVGQIFGLTSKIIAFLASLICASLPITGFIIWLGKRKKTKKPKGGREVTHKRAHVRQLKTN
ncbi:PepSY-associated TM helix domain-containing protein [Mucilaginibacter gynuensis]|uniref:PepSY-associated TM helix domain-containing protein n=1 Tax=Mucilaginibacter gynuensis TaxID=1302236 RepID=A0ABP8GJM8_9SPHI